MGIDWLLGGILPRQKQQADAQGQGQQQVKMGGLSSQWITDQKTYVQQLSQCGAPAFAGRDMWVGGYIFGAPTITLIDKKGFKHTMPAPSGNLPNYILIPVRGPVKLASLDPVHSKILEATDVAPMLPDTIRFVRQAQNTYVED